MEKLNKLIQRCKCGVHLAINLHRDYYETIEQYFKSNPINEVGLKDIDEDVYEKMKETDTIIELQYYPDTSVGFYKVYHYDLEMAIDEALSSLNVGELTANSPKGDLWELLRDEHNLLLLESELDEIIRLARRV